MPARGAHAVVPAGDLGKVEEWRGGAPFDIGVDVLEGRLPLAAVPVLERRPDELFIARSHRRPSIAHLIGFELLEDSRTFIPEDNPSVLARLTERS
jgi:hypothetical protein